VIDATRALLRALLPTAPIEERGNSERLTFVLPWPAGGDYRIAATVEGEEASLSAERRGATAGEYFWYHPFEDADFRGVGALYAAFHRELEILVSHPTRVIQSRRLLSWEFGCEYESTAGWQRLYGHAVMRWNGGVPAIDGDRRVYSSPALARGASPGSPPAASPAHADGE
jgi:hypothetical protein